MEVLRYLESIAAPVLTQDETDLDFGNATDAAFQNITTNATFVGGDKGVDADTTIWSTAMSLMCVFLWVYLCLCQHRAPGREHWRGAEIRERFQRLQEQERNRKAKEEQTPKQREELVERNMRTKRVVAKDENGSLTLGNVNDDNANSPAKTNPCPIGKGIYKTGDIEEGNMEDDDDEEHLCVICLDSFQVGDVVSWSRYSKHCHHVYHAECIQPWLQDKRQDECPSCRNRVILEGLPYNLDDTEKEASSAASSEESENSLEDQEDDSFFVIVHGMISRAAQKASYTLIGTKDSMDSADGKHEKTTADAQDMPIPPSPLRRVLSHGSVFRQRRPSLTQTPGISSVSSSSSNSSARNRPLRATFSNSSFSESPRTPNGKRLLRTSLEQQFNDEYEDQTEQARQKLLSSPISFRQVKSDIGSRFRRMPSFPTITEAEKKQQASSVIETIHSHDDDDDDDDIEDLRPTSSHSQNLMILKHRENDEIENGDESLGEADTSILAMMGYGRGGNLAKEDFSDKEAHSDEEDDIEAAVAD